MLEFRLLLKESSFSPLVVFYIGVLYPPNYYIFSDCCSQQESKLQGLEGEMSQADREEQRLVRLINSQQVKLGQLTRDEEQNVERTEQRNRALSGLCDQLTLTCKSLSVELLSDFDESLSVMIPRNVRLLIVYHADSIILIGSSLVTLC